MQLKLLVGAIIPRQVDPSYMHTPGTELLHIRGPGVGIRAALPFTPRSCAHGASFWAKIYETGLANRLVHSTRTWPDSTLAEMPCLGDPVNFYINAWRDL